MQRPVQQVSLCASALEFVLLYPLKNTHQNKDI